MHSICFPSCFVFLWHYSSPTCPATSQQNGRVERKLHHILDIVRALLLSAEVPALFWGEVALYVVHAINRIPSPVIQIKLHMSAFLGHLQTITTFAPSVLLVSFFFSHMSITNLSLSQGFVVFLATVKLKRGIGVMILSLIEIGRASCRERVLMPV